MSEHGVVVTDCHLVRPCPVCRAPGKLILRHRPGHECREGDCPCRMQFSECTQCDEYGFIRGLIGGKDE
jgi:hypothetical protein